jgi:hypothetical protein
MRSLGVAVMSFDLSRHTRVVTVLVLVLEVVHFPEPGDIIVTVFGVVKGHCQILGSSSSREASTNSRGLRSFSEQ